MCSPFSKMSSLELSPSSGEVVVELARRSDTSTTHEWAATNSMIPAMEGNAGVRVEIAPSELVDPAVVAREEACQNVSDATAHSPFINHASMSKPSPELKKNAKGNRFMKFLKRTKSTPQSGKVPDKYLVPPSCSTPVSTHSLPAKPDEVLNEVKRNSEGETKARKSVTPEAESLAKKGHENVPGGIAHSKLAGPASALVPQPSPASANPVRRAQNWFRNISKRTKSGLPAEHGQIDYLLTRIDEIWALEFSTPKITPAAAYAKPLPLNSEEALQERERKRKRAAKLKKAAPNPVRSPTSSSEPKNPTKVSKRWFSRRRPKRVSRQPLPGLEKWSARPRLLLLDEPSLLHFVPAVGNSLAILPEIYVYLRDLTQRRDGSLSFESRLSQLILDNGWFGQRVGNSLGLPKSSFTMKIEAYKTHYHGRGPQLEPVRFIESNEVMRSKIASQVPENMHVLVRIPECIVSINDLGWEEYKSSRGKQRRLRIKPRLARRMIAVADLMFDVNVPVLHTRNYLESLYGDHEFHPSPRVCSSWHGGVFKRVEVCDLCEKREKHEILTGDGNIDIISNHLKEGRLFCVGYMFKDSEVKWEEWTRARAEEDAKDHDRLVQGLELPEEGHFYQNHLSPHKIGTGCLGCGLPKLPLELRPLDHVFDANRNRMMKSVGNIFKSSSRSRDRKGSVHGPRYCYSDKCSHAKLEQPCTHHELKRWNTQAIEYFSIYGQRDYTRLKSGSPLSPEADDDWEPPKLSKPAQWKPEKDAAPSAPPATWRCTKVTPCPPCKSENKGANKWRPDARCPFSYHCYRELAVAGSVLLDGFAFDQPSNRFHGEDPYFNTNVPSTRRARPRRLSAIAMLEHKAAIAEIPLFATEADELLDVVAVPFRETNRVTAALEELPFFSVEDYDAKKELKVVNKGKGKTYFDPKSPQNFDSDHWARREMTHPEFLKSIGKSLAPSFHTARTSQSKSVSPNSSVSPSLTTAEGEVQVEEL